jgi:hypothetical protein
MDSPPPSLLPLEAVEARPDPLQEAGRAGCEPGPCRPDGGFAAQCMASKLQSGVEHCVCPVATSARLDFHRSARHSRVTDPNRRVRTRTHGGVGGVGPRGPPLSRSPKAFPGCSRKPLNRQKFLHPVIWNTIIFQQRHRTEPRRFAYGEKSHETRDSQAGHLCGRHLHRGR